MYYGISLKWDYVARTVDLSMPGYIEKSLETYYDERPKFGFLKTETVDWLFRSTQEDGMSS